MGEILIVKRYQRIPLLFKRSMISHNASSKSQRHMIQSNKFEQATTTLHNDFLLNTEQDILMLGTQKQFYYLKFLKNIVAMQKSKNTKLLKLYRPTKS
jgi:hypothetical protein